MAIRVSNRDDEERKLCGGGHTCIVREIEKEKKTLWNPDVSILMNRYDKPTLF